MKKILVSLAGVVLASTALAQAQHFEGFSLGGNLTSTKTTTELSSGLSTDGSTNGVDLQLQYSFALAPQFVMGVGLSLGTGNNASGANGAVEFSTRNRSALEFTPGFALSDSVLLYGKVAALSATAVAEGGGTSLSETTTGVGYGLGLRVMADKNLFYQVGLDSNSYQEKDLGGGVSYKPKSNVLSLGIGYKF